VPLLRCFPAGLRLRGTKLIQKVETKLIQKVETKLIQKVEIKINLLVDIQNRRPGTNCSAANTLRSAIWSSGGKIPRPNGTDPTVREADAGPISHRHKSEPENTQPATAEFRATRRGYLPASAGGTPT
jgi:hypothetical protein